jgi:hypothetical protein
MRKAVLNKDYVFEWNAPTPINGTPVLTLNAIDYSLSQSRSSATVSAIATDRRTLTVDNQVTGLQRDQVKAFLITNGDTFYSVNVDRVVGTTAILSEPLPREIDLSTSASLEFALWTYTVPSSATALTTANTYPYQINFVSDVGSNNAPRQEKGLFKSTPRPFDTSLSHDDLVQIFAPLSDMVPRRQSDFSNQINAALDEIILQVRDVVLAEDVTEDEVFNPEQFKLAHAYCTAALIYEQNLQMDIAEQMRNRCHELMEIALRSIALDLDGDGVIDSGELDRRESGGKTTDFRASWKNYTRSSNDSFFIASRGMRH